MNFAPFLQLLCNASLAEDSVPSSHKCAVVFPSTKQQGLDPNTPSNFRPISKLRLEYYHSHLSSCGNALRISCSPTQALTLVESAAII